MTTSSILGKWVGIIQATRGLFWATRSGSSHYTGIAPSWNLMHTFQYICRQAQSVYRWLIQNTTCKMELLKVRNFLQVFFVFLEASVFLCLTARYSIPEESSTYSRPYLPRLIRGVVLYVFSWLKILDTSFHFFWSMHRLSMLLFSLQTSETEISLLFVIRQGSCCGTDNGVGASPTIFQPMYSFIHFICMVRSEFWNVACITAGLFSRRFLDHQEWPILLQPPWCRE